MADVNPGSVAPAPVPAPTIASPYRQALAAAHAAQGTTNDCGPIATSIVINAMLDAGIDPKAMAQALNRPVWRGPLPLVRRVPNAATFPWGIADALREHGLLAWWRIFASEDLLRRQLARGAVLLPVYGGLTPRPWAHVAVLVAYDEAAGWQFVDPAAPDGKPRWMDAATFRRRWRLLANTVIIATKV